MTKAIDFIVNDAAKARGQGAKAFAIAACILALACGLALGLRPDREDIGPFYALQSALLGVITFGLLWLQLSQRIGATKRRWILRGAVILALAVSLAHEGLHPFATQTPLIRFWRETFGCFVKGVVVGLGCGTVLTFAVFRFLPTPDRRWQLGLAASASLAGLVMLNLNCPSTVVSHIVLAHWAQGLLVTAAVSAWQGVLFKRQLRRVLGAGLVGSGAVDFLED